MSTDISAATDPRTLDEESLPEPPVVRTGAPPVSYNARLGSACMIWAMVIGIGFFVAIELFWALTHVGDLFK